MPIETGAITALGNWTFTNNTWAKKWGNVVMWQCHFYPSDGSTMQANTNYLVGQLPEGFRPPKQNTGVGYALTSGQSMYTAVTSIDQVPEGRPEGSIVVRPSSNIGSSVSRYAAGSVLIN